MSVLSDASIRALGSSLIEPFDPERVQPASYDLSLNNEILLLRTDRGLRTLGHGHTFTELPYIDLRTYDAKKYTIPSKLLPPDGQRHQGHVDEGYVLAPGESILGSTAERVCVPADLVARVEGKSSLGRLFLQVHSTAGFVDPGFRGQVTLEMTNIGPWRILLRPGMKIAQVNFTTLDRECERPYGSPGLGSHYQGQRGPTPGSTQTDTSDDEDRHQTTAAQLEEAKRELSAAIEDEWQAKIARGTPAA